jgi:hypothetical protein
MVPSRARTQTECKECPSHFPSSIISPPTVSTKPTDIESSELEGRKFGQRKYRNFFEKWGRECKKKTAKKEY